MLILLLAIPMLVMGLNAVQKGEIAWTRKKNITGPAAKRIGVVLITISATLLTISVGFSFMRGFLEEERRGPRTNATTTWP